ncbi:MAG TPA: hypothetical protein VF310_05930 [Vicinamibacteria bacterium]|jgi:hypothetical protein
MSKLALVGLLGVTMLGVACGTNPMAVETASLTPAVDGMASASAPMGKVGRLPNTPAPACPLASVSLKVVGVKTGNDNGYLVRVSAEYLDGKGAPIPTSACEGPRWSAEGASISPLTKGGFVADMNMPGIRAVASATGPNNLGGSMTVDLSNR